MNRKGNNRWIRFEKNAKEPGARYFSHFGHAQNYILTESNLEIVVSYNRKTTKR